MSDGSITIDTKLDNGGLEKGLKRISSIAKKALQGVTIATGAVATSFAGIVTASVKARGELEQQIGGIETLFVNKSGDASKQVIENANRAYQTAGMSAIDYMQTATSFSASLLKSLGNDTKKAAEVTDRAIIDMSDNANKMGTDITSIQNAYQGFAKQNYTMLDNLKLGYGGTKSEMEKLIKDASKMKDVQKELNVTVKDGDLSFGNIVNAISVMQSKLGITGTTAKEASETLQGSLASMKASWQNFLSGSGGITEVIETVKDVAKNVKRITKEAITFIISEIKQQLINNGFENMANAIDVVIEKVKLLFDWLKTNLSIIIEKILKLYNDIKPYIPIIEAVVGAILAMTVALNLMATTVKIVNAVFAFFNAILALNPIVLVVVAIVGLVTAFVILWKKCEGFRNFWIGLWKGIKSTFTTVWESIKLFFTETIPNAFKELINKFIEIGNEIKSFFANLWNSIIDFFSQTIPQWINNVIEWFKQLPYNIGYAIGSIIGFFLNLGIKIGEWIKTDLPNIINNIINWFKELPGRIWEWLVNVVNNIHEWGSNTYNASKEWVVKTVNNVINWFKELPSKIWIWLKNTINNVITFGMDMASRAKEGAKKTYENIINTLKELPSKMLDIGKNIVEGLWNGIKNAWSWIKNKVSEFARGILDGMKNALRNTFSVKSIQR